MATDATGTPTSLGIPKFNTSVDNPSGLGTNAMMDAINDLLVSAPLSGEIAGIAVGSVPVWDGSAWVKPTGTPDGSKFLRDDGAWAAAGGSTPTGVVLPYAGATAPDSTWLICDGAAVSRSTYSTLFGLISETFGVGDGSTTFNIPDLRGRMVAGKGTNAAVNALGDSDGVTEANRRPQHRHTPHTHDVNTGTGSGGGKAISAPNSFVSESAFANRAIAKDGGSGTATDSLDAPAFLVLNYIIKT